MDAACYTKLTALRDRPRPFLLYTDSVIYRCRDILELEPMDEPGAIITVRCQRGEQSVRLRDIVSVDVTGHGYEA